MIDPSTYLNDEITKKKLGQYFTDPNIVDFLLILTDIKEADKVIDPMAGIGNMLEPLLKNGHDPYKLYGIEIDPKAGGFCKERLGLQNFVIDNAFNKSSYSKFDSICEDGCDLVITNPPYVRYQSMLRTEEDNMNLPNAKEIRKNLLETLDSLKFMDLIDNKDYKIMINAYSGLSDLAVPAWILCTALLKVGGKLAIVVPDTWLNREYAAIVQYILLKWFEIEYIVEDVNRVWFSDAQVKTNLIVARRIPRNNSIYSTEKYEYHHIEVHGSKNQKLGFDLSTIDNKCLKSVLKSGKTSEIQNLKCEIRSIDHMVSSFLANCKTDWLDRIEGRENDYEFTPIPYELTKLLKTHEKIKTVDLENLGISVGQGLRTGANKFFYFTSIETDNDYEIIQSDNYFGAKMIRIPSKFLYKVIRKQSELTDCLYITGDDVKGRVLYIQDAITKSDMIDTDSKYTCNYSVLNDEIGDFIEAASLYPANENNPNKFIPQLSAVKPNVRFEEKNNRRIKRYWYMLPRFTKRHLPDFFIPRINSDSPNVYLVKDVEIAIDANFSTLWIDEKHKEYKLAYFAILNSYWVKAYLESIATVMGGGALKVEASHIKKIRIPLLNKIELEKLTVYGSRLSEAKEQKEILDIIGNVDNLLLKKTDINGSVLRQYVRGKIIYRKK